MWPDPHIACDATDTPLHCGLGKADRAIWNAAIKDGIIAPLLVWWNQVCGSVPEWTATIADERRRMWIEATYCKRPDVIFTQGDTTYVTEIKPFASYTAFGQALMYQRLAERKPGAANNITGAILTDQADPDLHKIRRPNDPIIFELGRQIAPRPKFPT